MVSEGGRCLDARREIVRGESLLKCDLQAVNLPPLDAAASGARRRGTPDPTRERPRFLKRQATKLFWMATNIAASASTPGELPEGDRLELERLREEAGELVGELVRRRPAMQLDFARAAGRPAARSAPQASGAQPGEPIAHSDRVLLNALRTFGVGRELAANLVVTGGDQGGDKGNEGKGRKGRGKR